MLQRIRDRWCISNDPVNGQVYRKGYYSRQQYHYLWINGYSQQSDLLAAICRYIPGYLFSFIYFQIQSIRQEKHTENKNRNSFKSVQTLVMCISSSGFDIHKYTLIESQSSFSLGEHLRVVWKIQIFIHIEVVFFNFEIKSYLWLQQKLF